MNKTKKEQELINQLQELELELALKSLAKNNNIQQSKNSLWSKLDISAKLKNLEKLIEEK